MPVSNGQVTSRDIRQAAVKTLHIVDDAVATAKIPDLAVTFPDKIDDPIWVTTFGTFSASNVTVNTTPTIQISETVDVPAWVDQVRVLVIGVLQISNTSGSTFNARPATYADGIGGSGVEASVANNETGAIVDVTVANTTGVAGSSITVEMESSVNTGSNSSNQHFLYGFMTGER